MRAMNRKFIFLLILLIGGATVGVLWMLNNQNLIQQNPLPPADKTIEDSNIDAILGASEPLSVLSLRDHVITDGKMTVEEELSVGSNYTRYIASYTSENNTIYGLLTVPSGQRPASGWPVIIFNHGYIPPTQYQTTERYVAYQDGFARNGYITFKSDYRGHGRSEGDPAGGYGSNAYTIDVLSALESVKNFQDARFGAGKIADSNRIGMWGHSMGGFITLRSMVVRDDIKAGVIWGGVVASYPDLINNWRRGRPTAQPLPSGARRWRQILVEKYGEPTDSSEFWRTLSANSYLSDISGPVQLHHGTLDESVPYDFSEKLEQQLKSAQKPVELYLYENDDHDITANFNTALNRSIDFFDTHVKNN